MARPRKVTNIDEVTKNFKKAINRSELPAEAKEFYHSMIHKDSAILEAHKMLMEVTRIQLDNKWDYARHLFLISLVQSATISLILWYWIIL